MPAFLGLLAASAAVAIGPPAQPWHQKVDAWVLETLAAEGEVEYLLFLEEQADVRGAATLRSKEARGRYVFERLTEVAERTQGPVLAELGAAGVEHRPYWIANMIWVRSDAEQLEWLARRSDIAHVYANPRVALKSPHRISRREPATPTAPEPNLLQVGAPQVFWSAGIHGEGVVLAAQDSGQEWTHPALRDQYRGWDGASADHNYNWHDAIHSGGGSCGADSPEPCDDNDHGTATMGVMVGDDGAGNQIGMAPGARWIGCRNMDQGVGTPATYSECFQFFLAPTDLNDENPDPSLAPHAINNSWVCPPSEGCVDPNVLLTVVENARAAGIVVVASAGNGGSSCATVADPPAIYDAAISVGSVNIFGEISTFSSRGPVTVDGSERLKPDFMAPGEDIRSSVRGDGYLSFDGTSLSGPHVAGLAGLLISALPCLEGDVDAIEEFMREDTLFFETTQECGGIPGDEIPNNVYGWGIIQSAMPPEELCAAAVGGSLSGVDSRSARCLNQTTGQSVSLPLDGATTWDCEAAGLAVSPGDRISQSALGTALPTPIGGSATGVTPRRARCQNRTTGQQVSIPLTDASWDCTAAGLLASPGDTVIQTVLGLAD